MTRVRGLVSRVLALARRRRLDAQLDEELEGHLRMLADEYEQRGLTARDARHAALQSFGGVVQTTERYREQRGFPMIETIWQDVRYAVRTLRNNPTFTIAAVVSIALGIGATTAVFSVIDGVVLKTLSVRAPHQLVEPLTDFGSGQAFNAFSYQALTQFRDHAELLDGVVASHSSTFSVLTNNASAEIADGQYVTGNYFEVLGVSALRGRSLQSFDDSPNATPAAVLGHAYWQRRFGAEPDIVGDRITLEGHPFIVVGVMPPTFRGTLVGKTVDLWVPLTTERILRQGETWTAAAGYKWLQILARMKPDTSLEQAEAELARLFQTGVVEAELGLTPNPDAQHYARTWRLAVAPAGAGLSSVRRQFEQPLWILLAASGALLLIACVNVANLLLARASARQHEIGLRLSLGAARSRVVRQLLTESMVLAGAGATLGIVLAYTTSGFVTAFFATTRNPITLEVRPDLRLLAFSAAVGIAAAMVFGIVPAWRATRDAHGLSSRGRVRGHHKRRALSRTLIIGQVALSVVMLVCAGLFMRSLRNVRAIDAGFEATSVLLIATDASRSGLTPEAQRTAYRDALRRLRDLPGVQSASLSWVTPIEGGGTTRTVFIETAAAARQVPDLPLNWVSPDYFTTMKTSFQAGRDFTWQDTRDKPRVAIINAQMARSYFGKSGALGQRITLDETTYEIVGVASDAKYLELRDRVPPTLYLAAFQRDDAEGQFALRTRSHPLSVATAARAAIRTAAPTVSLGKVRTLAQQVDASIVRERILGALSGVFATMGLIMAAVGLYGVMAYGVAQRTSEIGIRMALGAPPATVWRMVVREAVQLTAAGVGVGVIAALLVARAIAAFLFQVGSSDPVTLLSVVAVMLATGLTAAYLPGRRAARLDPVQALRAE